MHSTFKLNTMHKENPQAQNTADNGNATSGVVMPSFLKTKYSLEELDQYIMELSARTDRHIHRGKLEDIKKLIRWRRRYDALNGA